VRPVDVVYDGGVRVVVESARGCIPGGREEATLPEHGQFAEAIIWFIVILIGAYWFVLSSGREEQWRTERKRGAE
jgi:hypothetical protein